MRKALNDNTLVQVAVLGVLALVVGFLLITRVAHKSSTSTSTTSTTTASAVPGAVTTPTDSSATATAPTATDSSATATTPESTVTTPSSSTAPASVATAPAAAAAAAPGKFVIGPGLPAPVVKAYAQGKVVVLLVVRRGGIDDDAVKASVEHMRHAPDVALFVTNAGHVSRYSRIASGVDLDRVPALIVLRPRKLSRGSPQATVSYGFRGPDSIAQAVHNALYKGPSNLPYYPK